MSRLRKTILTPFALALLCFILPTVSRADTVVFTYNGAGNGTYSNGATGGGLTGGENATAPSGEQFRELYQGNTQTLVTIGNLAPSTVVTVSFNLYAIRSLDGNGLTGSDADIFSVGFGFTGFTSNFANLPGATQAYPNALPPGGSFAPRTGASANNTLGFTFNGTPMDSTYTLSFTTTIGPGSPNNAITLRFLGIPTEGRSSESYGIDNIVVSIAPASPTAVPEPATMILLTTGLAGVAAKVRRRR